ncbi:MAG: hypothetical protein ACREBU_20765 [Nitrososphaera sp.]
MISDRTLVCSILLVVSISILQTHVFVANAVTAAAVQLTMPELKSIHSTIQDKVSVGNQVFISTTLANMDAEHPRPFLAFIEVRNSVGISMQISSVSSVIPRDGLLEISASWVLYSSDAYVLRTFAVTGFENPEILSIVVERHVVVTDDS